MASGGIGRLDDIDAIDDPRLPEVLPWLDRLVELTRAWSRGADTGEAAAVRRRALLLQHDRYAALVPAYRRLAEEQDLREPPDLDAVVNHLMVTADLFKSYDPDRLAARDFASMTAWLGEISTMTPRPDLSGVDSIERWRDSLEACGLFLTCSSGTSGRLSFVPRDRRTSSSLRSNGLAYAHPVWEPGPDGYPPFDCLLLCPRGRATGLQAAAAGIARMGTRLHYLTDDELGPDRLWAASAGIPAAAAGEPMDDAYQRSLDFALRAAAQGRRLLVFGAPFHIQALCDHAASTRGGVRLTPGSIVVSGGGWKAAAGRRIRDDELLERISAALSIPASHVIDTYSTAELNCVLMTCAERRHHVPPLVEPVVLDDALSGAIDSEGTGILGFLDPFALSYPGFVVTGDLGHLTREPCPCGLPGWSIAGEIRRAERQPERGCAGALAAAMA